MAIKNILVAYDGSEGARAALGLGLRMAGKYDAHLTGLLPHGKPSSHLRRLLASSSELKAVLAENEGRVMAEAEAQFRAQTGTRENVHWLKLDAESDAAIVEHARYFDVTLIGQYDETLDETAFALHPDRIALQSGRPIIVVPRGHDRPLGEHAVVAWDGQRAAARALSDAMQILETKQLVTILTVSNEETAPFHPGERLRAHLVRHGIETRWVPLTARGTPVAEIIVDWCRENAPDLLVMGAYEHSKFREDVVGGVTNTVLKRIPLPVLLAH
jgi:nucleotide-binding universal stress UspA family protein